MQTYRHTQHSLTLRVGLLGSSGLILGACLVAGDPFAVSIGIVVGGILALCGILFSALTVEVDRRALRLAFGWGWAPIHREIPIERIAGAVEVRNSPFWGWGIRWVPGGWMWNVWGLDAVELSFVGRERARFRIGTDDPDGLARAIRERVQRGWKGSGA